MRKGRKEYFLCDLCEFLAFFALKFWINYPEQTRFCQPYNDLPSAFPELQQMHSQYIQHLQVYAQK